MEGVVLTAVYSKDGIQWTIDDKEAYRALRSMVSNVSDFRPYWPRIEDAIREDFTQRFNTADGGSWPGPKSFAYMMWKARRGSGRTLVLTGGMMRSFTTKGAQGQTVRRTPRELFFRSTYKKQKYGTSGGATPLAAFLQYGMGYRIVNEASPFLRKRMGDAASEIALEWKQQWEGGGR